VRAIAEHNRNVVAVLFEPVQGEGGIHPADLDYMRALRALCDQQQWLFMVDEVQSGIGRTGSWFAFQHAGIEPDVMTLAKGLGSGVPIGACLARGPAAGVFKPGTHGSTFGGNPLACAAALTTLEVLERDELLGNAIRQGDAIRAGFRAAFKDDPAIRGYPRRRHDDRRRTRPALRCSGQAMALEAGVLINVTSDTTIRLVPPLVYTDADSASLSSADAHHSKFPRGRTARRLTMTEPRHFLQLTDLSREELDHVFARTRWIKDKFKRYEQYWPLQDRTLVMIFEKQSTRTRLSFEAGMHQMGGSGDLPEHARLAARSRRTGRRRGRGDFAHVRHGHDPHLRADHHRALRRQFARAGDQRSDQRIPPLPDAGRHLHLDRAPRRYPGARRWRGSAIRTTCATPGCRRPKCSIST
jgi:hypothetical protein